MEHTATLIENNMRVLKWHMQLPPRCCCSLHSVSGIRGAWGTSSLGRSTWRIQSTTVNMMQTDATDQKLRTGWFLSTPMKNIMKWNEVRQLDKQSLVLSQKKWSCPEPPGTNLFYCEETKPLVTADWEWNKALEGGKNRQKLLQMFYSESLLRTQTKPTHVLSAPWEPIDNLKFLVVCITSFQSSCKRINMPHGFRQTQS